MRRREEKRRKFHEAVLNTLYPPQPSPQHQEDEQKPLTVTTSSEDFDVALIPDDCGPRRSGSSSSEEDGDGECGAQKLTRAQRKRLRKKKLKEELSRRRQIIGPLLPPSSYNDGDGACGGDVDEDTPNVRRNANQSDSQSAADCNQPGEPSCGGGGGGSQSKLKQRRRAKRLPNEKRKSYIGEICDQDQNFRSYTVESCEKDTNDGMGDGQAG